jgi:CheY-like chemotaxis protein
MRPPRQILLIDANEERRSVRAYALRVRGFRVTQAAAFKEYAEAKTIYDKLVGKEGDKRQFDLCIGVWPVDLPGRCAMPILLIYRPGQEEARDALTVDAAVCDPSMEELVARVKYMTARKRGPARQDAEPITPSAKHIHSGIHSNL